MRGFGKVLTLFFPSFQRVVIFIHKGFIYNKDYFYNGILKYSKEMCDVIIQEKANFYSIRNIKKKGGIRKLSCIARNSSLYELQRNLVSNFLDKIPLPDYVFGFVRGLSYRDYLTPHKDSKYYLRTDIKNFFDSIDINLVRDVLSEYVKTDNKSKFEILDLIQEIITLNNLIPQGAVTSPSISNLVFRQLDLRIYKYCKKLEITYTRYADDLLFSSSNEKLHKKFFANAIKIILRSKGFYINSAKTKLTSSFISLSGFVVGNDIRISRKKKSDINKILFEYSRGGPPKDISDYFNRLNDVHFDYRRIDANNNYFSSKSELINFLCGYRSFLLQWIPNDDSKTYLKYTILIKNVESLIEKIEALQ
jgi:retron-type reverse transcriptase